MTMTRKEATRKTKHTPINYKYFLLYKRLAKRFKLATIERHWGRAQGAVA